MSNGCHNRPIEVEAAEAVKSGRLAAECDNKWAFGVTRVAFAQKVLGRQREHMADK